MTLPNFRDGHDESLVSHPRTSGEADAEALRDVSPLLRAKSDRRLFLELLGGVALGNFPGVEISR